MSHITCMCDPRGPLYLRNPKNDITHNITLHTLGAVIVMFYYPPEEGSMKYCCLGVFQKEYFRPTTKRLGSKHEKRLRGSTQATILPLAIILTAALWASVFLILILQNECTFK